MFDFQSNFLYTNSEIKSNIRKRKDDDTLQTSFNHSGQFIRIPKHALNLHQT